MTMRKIPVPACWLIVLGCYEDEYGDLVLPVTKTIAVSDMPIRPLDIDVSDIVFAFEDIAMVIADAVENSGVGVVSV